MMRKITKKLTHFIYITVLFFCASTMAQNQTDNWQLLTTIDGVEISYKKTFCDYNEVLLIKVVNTTNQEISLNLNYTFHSNNVNIGEGSLSEIVLGANAEISSECGDDLLINVYQHFTMFNENEFTLTVTKL